MVVDAWEGMHVASVRLRSGVLERRAGGSAGDPSPVKGRQYRPANLEHTMVVPGAFPISNPAHCLAGPLKDHGELVRVRLLVTSLPVGDLLE